MPQRYYDHDEDSSSDNVNNIDSNHDYIKRIYIGDCKEHV